MGRYPAKEAVMQVEAEQGSRLVDDVLERVGQTVGQRAQASAVFGEPVQREALTVIPVAKARFGFGGGGGSGDRKSTRLNSSHLGISYAVFCLKKKNTH